MTCFLKRFISLLILPSILMPLLFSLPISAQSFTTSAPVNSPPQRLIRVGFPNFKGFSEIDEDGNCSGYIYEYLQEIAKYTGWEYEFIPDSENPEEDLLSKVATGEVDLIGGIVRNQQTEALFDFPEISSGITYAALIVPLSNTKYTESDYQTFQGMRVGYLGTATQRLEKLNKFSSINAIELETIPYATLEDFERDLLSGKVDAFLGGDVSPLPNTRILTRFSSTPHYFAVSKNNPTILNGLNMAISKIKEININYDIELYSKHFPAYSTTPFFLSEKESAYIRNLEPLKVVSGANSIPVDYFDNEGNFRGITADVFSYISEKTGIDFEFISAKNQAEAYDMAKNGEADIVTNILQDSQMAPPSFFTSITPYLSVPIVVAKSDHVKSTDLEKATMAVLNGFHLNFPSGTYTQRLYDTPEECLTAVSRGEADYYYGSSYSISYYQRAFLLDNLSLVSLPESGTSLSFAIAKPADTTLIGIFTKTIHSFEDNEIQRIIFDNTSNLKYDISFPVFLRNNFIPVLLAVIIFASIIIAIIIWFLQKKRHLEELETKRYRALAELSDEILFQYNFNKDRLEISEKHASKLFLEPVIEKFYKKLQSGQFYFSEKDLEFLNIDSSVSEKKDFKKSADFNWLLPDGSKQWFRIVYVITFAENHRPSTVIGKFWNIDQELIEKAHLLSLAEKDGLTGLYNKGAIERLVSEYLDFCGKEKLNAFLLVDVDNFKFINDNFGHHCGDETLKLIAHALRAPFRSMDFVGRVGGDEFIILIIDLPSRDLVHEKCADILNFLSMPHEIEGHMLQLSCSIGVAFYPDDAITYRELYQKSDQALYTVKRDGKMGYKFYEEPPLQD